MIALGGPTLKLCASSIPVVFPSSLNDSTGRAHTEADALPLVGIVFTRLNDSTGRAYTETLSLVRKAVIMNESQ